LETNKPKREAGVLPNSSFDIEEIATRAYEIYVERGRSHGNDVADWLLAEHDVEQRHRNSQ